MDLGSGQTAVVVAAGRAHRRRRAGLGRHGLRGELPARGQGLCAGCPDRPPALAHLDRGGRRAARPGRRHARGRDAAGRGDRARRRGRASIRWRRRVGVARIAGRAGRQRHADRRHRRFPLPACRSSDGKVDGPGVLAGRDRVGLGRASRRAGGRHQGFAGRRHRPGGRSSPAGACPSMRRCSRRPPRSGDTLYAASRRGTRLPHRGRFGARWRRRWPSWTGR